MRASFEITYAAHTNSCTFLLDAEGFCRRIVPNPALKRSPKGRDAAAAAARCVDAQYVASLDASLPGMLAEMPRVGIPMIFARVDQHGRVSLVRTGIVTRFDSHRAEDPFAERAPSISVETSAPVIPPSAPNPARPREIHEHDDVNLAQTAEYEADAAHLMHRAAARHGAPPTLRRPPGMIPPQSAPRQSEARPTEAYAKRPRGEHGARPVDPSRTPRAGVYPAVDNAAGRRSGGR